MKVITLKQATGKQLQEVAKYAKLQDSPNQVHGLYQAIFCSDPSPMQVSVLRIGLRSEGINYVKVTEVCTPATAADKLPDVMHKALDAMVKSFQGPKAEYKTLVAGRTLYATFPANDFDEAKWYARELAKPRSFRKMPFLEKHHDGWRKSVRVGRHTYTALIEAAGTNVRFSVFKGE
jgi:hypothetical protein